MPIIVVDTNVLVSALRGGGGVARQVIRACLEGDYDPVVGAALLAEYEDVPSRNELFEASILTARERDDVLNGLLHRCRWVEVFYAWRPNLPDEGDNHLIELAVAARADAIVTRNLRHLAQGELRFPSIRIVTPEQCLKEFPCRP